MVLIAVIYAMPANAQYKTNVRNKGGYTSGGDNYHFAYISGGVGYSALECADPALTTRGGAGGFIGAGYEFRLHGLWLSAGAQMSFHNSEAGLGSYRIDRAGYDTQGKEVMFHYNIEERDLQDWKFVEIPIMIGWYFHGFHIGAGPKVGYAIDSRVTAYGTYELSGTNELYGIEFRNMPEQGYTTYDYLNKENKAELNTLVSLVGEVGYDLLSSVPTRSSICHVLKVAFYFEYGLNNLVKPVATSNRTEFSNNATKIKVNPYLASGMTEPYRIVPYFTGVKFTYLIGGSKGYRAGGFHKGCHCYNH